MAALAGGLAAASPFDTGGAGAARGADAARLNVVLILTDDERAGIDRPTVQRLLGAEGVTFTRFFATTPVCCPARAGILTGQYSHHNGVVGNAGPNAYPSFDEASNLAVWLHDSGYETALVGKYLNGYPVSGDHRVPHGWSDWQAIDSTSAQQRYYGYDLNENGRLVHYGERSQDYSTSVLTGKAVDFLERAKGPFFLYFAPIAPHLPATAARRPRRRSRHWTSGSPSTRKTSVTSPGGARIRTGCGRRRSRLNTRSRSGSWRRCNPSIAASRRSSPR